MDWKNDKALVVLSFFTIFFAGVTLGVAFLRPNDGQLYQTFVSLLSGFGGAILLHLKPADKPIPPGTATDTTTHQVTVTPPPLPPIERGGFGATGTEVPEDLDKK